MTQPLTVRAWFRRLRATAWAADDTTATYYIDQIAVDLIAGREDHAANRLLWYVALHTPTGRAALNAQIEKMMREIGA